MDSSRGSAESKEYTAHATVTFFFFRLWASGPLSPSLASLLWLPHATIAQASSSGGNSSMPALPLAWNLANRSPNVDHSHSHTHRLALTEAPGCRLSLTVVPYCIASRPGVPGERHLTARNVSFSPWGIQLRGQQACSGASDANSRARADSAETNTAIRSLSLPASTHHHSFPFLGCDCDCLCFLVRGWRCWRLLLSQHGRMREGTICRRLLVAYKKTSLFSSGLN